VGFRKARLPTVIGNWPISEWPNQPPKARRLLRRVARFNVMPAHRWPREGRPRKDWLRLQGAYDIASLYRLTTIIVFDDLLTLQKDGREFA